MRDGLLSPRRPFQQTLHAGKAATQHSESKVPKAHARKTAKAQTKKWA
jgi:hypothetical protein